MCEMEFDMTTLNELVSQLCRKRNNYDEIESEYQDLEGKHMQR